MLATRLDFAEADPAQTPATRAGLRPPVPASPTRRFVPATKRPRTDTAASPRPDPWPSGNGLAAAWPTRQADPFQFFWNELGDLPRRLGIGAGDLFEQCALRFPLKRPPSYEQLVEHHAQAENIATAVDAVSFAARLLGAHIGGRAGVRRTFFEILFAQGDAEVGQKRLALKIDQDIPRLNVAMNQAAQMGVMQRFRQGRRQLGGFSATERTLLDPHRQVGPLNIFRDDEARQRCGASYVEHRHDMGMVEPRRASSPLCGTVPLRRES